MATTSNGIKIIYGAGGLSSRIVEKVPSGFKDFHEYSKKVLDTLESEVQILQSMPGGSQEDYSVLKDIKTENASFKEEMIAIQAAMVEKHAYLC